MRISTTILNVWDGEVGVFVLQFIYLSSKIVKDLFIAFLSLFISDLFDLLDLIYLLVLEFSSSWFLSGVSL